MHRLLKAALAGTAALAMSAAATGCGSGSTSKGASESTVRVWIMGDDGRKFSDLVADFTKSTNIKVQVDAIPWDNVNEKLTTAVASGNGPDVMQIGLSLLSSFQSAGALLDLTPHFGGHAKLKSENFVDAVSPDKLNPAGKVLSIPWISDTRILFYRTDILAETGFAKPPATWTELHDYAVKLAQRGKGKYGYYIPQWDAPAATQLTWFKINGELPTVKSALSDPSLTSDPNVQVYAKQLQKAKLLPVLPAWDKISKELLDSLNTIALKGADPTATLAKLNQDVANLQK